jgi:hypothetical protein
VNLWTDREPGEGPVDKAVSSPVRAHRLSPLVEPKRGVFPVIHTLYDY